MRPFFLGVGETIRVDNVVPDQVIVVNMGHLQVLRPLDGHWVISGLMKDGGVLGMTNAMKNEPMDFMLCAPIATDLWFIETHELKMILFSLLKPGVDVYRTTMKDKLMARKRREEERTRRITGEKKNEEEHITVRIRFVRWGGGCREGGEHTLYTF